MQRFLLFTVLIAVGLAAAVFGVMAWQSAGEAEISLMGWLALAGGVFFTVLLGGGLMGLVFYSSRHGHDDNHYQGPPGPPDA